MTLAKGLGNEVCRRAILSNEKVSGAIEIRRPRHYLQGSNPPYAPPLSTLEAIDEEGLLRQTVKGSG